MEENANATEQQVDKVPYTVNFDERPKLPFVGQTCYLTSDELCRIVSELFHGVFADYEGCQLELSSGEPTVNLFFNHAKYSDDAHVAVSMSSTGKTGNNLMDRIRFRDQAMKDGDRYLITEDGKDILTKLLTNRFYNNGKPQWGQIVAEHVERTPYNMYTPQQTPQFTKIRQIDLNRLVAFIFGRKDSNGKDIEYVASVMNSVPSVMGNVQSKNFMIQITVVNADNVKELYERLGFGSMGSDIVR